MPTRGRELVRVVFSARALVFAMIPVRERGTRENQVAKGGKSRTIVNAARQPRRIAVFAWRTLVAFQRNRGLLLASALGYNTLLSIVPLFALVMVALASQVDPDILVAALRTQTDVLLPGRGAAINEVLAEFVERRATIGVVGTGVLVFFSAIAFRMLDEAFAVVFQRNRGGREPHRFRAFVLPLAYVLLIGIGLLMLTLLMVVLDTLPASDTRVFGRSLDGALATTIVKGLAFVGLVLLLSSFYWVMPRPHIAVRRALVGGFVAAVLWEAVRSAMLWYFANLSLVDVVYGPLGTAIVALLGLEVAAIILLLGAQVIAELERAAAAGRPWYDPPTGDPPSDLS